MSSIPQDEPKNLEDEVKRLINEKVISEQTGKLYIGSVKARGEAMANPKSELRATSGRSNRARIMILATAAVLIALLGLWAGK